MKYFYEPVDLRSQREMTSYLLNHFRNYSVVENTYLVPQTQKQLRKISESC